MFRPVRYRLQSVTLDQTTIVKYQFYVANSKTHIHCILLLSLGFNMLILNDVLLLRVHVEQRLAYT